MFNIIEIICKKVQRKNLKEHLVIFLLLIFLIQEGFLIRKIIHQKNKVDLTQAAIFEASQKQQGTSIFIEGDEWRQRFVLAAKLYGRFQPQSGGQVAWFESGTKGDVLILITGEKNIQIHVK